jgi:hypothetical protein
LLRGGVSTKRHNRDRGGLRSQRFERFSRHPSGRIATRLATPSEAPAKGAAGGALIARPGAAMAGAGAGCRNASRGRLADGDWQAERHRLAIAAQTGTRGCIHILPARID